MTTFSPCGLQRGQRLSGACLDRIGHGEQRGRGAVDGDEHDRRALAPQRLGPCGERQGVRAALGQERVRADRDRASLDGTCDAAAWEGLEIDGLGELERACDRAAATTAAAIGCSLDRSRLAASPRRRRRNSRRHLDRRDPRPALGQRPRLVHDERVDALEQFERLGVLTRTPARGPRPVPTMIAIGVASPSAQGQAMIKHGDGADQRVREARLRSPTWPTPRTRRRRRRRPAARTSAATRSARR